MKEIKANKTRSFLLDFINHEMTQKMKENDQTKLNHKTSQQIISEYDCYEVHIDNELVTYRSPTYKNRQQSNHKHNISNLSSRKTSFSDNSETYLQRKDKKNLSHNITSTDFDVVLLFSNNIHDLQNAKDSFRLHSKSLRNTAFKLKHLISKKQTK
jgi:hypothetical protein